MWQLWCVSGRAGREGDAEKGDPKKQASRQHTSRTNFLAACRLKSGAGAHALTDRPAARRTYSSNHCLLLKQSTLGETAKNGHQKQSGAVAGSADFGFACGRCKEPPLTSKDHIATVRPTPPSTAPPLVLM